MLFARPVFFTLTIYSSLIENPRLYASFTRGLLFSINSSAAVSQPPPPIVPSCISGTLPTDRSFAALI